MNKNLSLKNSQTKFSTLDLDKSDEPLPQIKYLTSKKDLLTWPEACVVIQKQVFLFVQTCSGGENEGALF